MKTIVKIILILIFLTTSYKSINAQSFCSTPSTTRNASFESSMQRMNETGPFYLKIYVHVIRKSNGTGGQSEQDVNDALSFLDTDFQPHNIYFIWDCQTDYIDNDDWFQEPDTGIYSINNHYDGIDIYLFPNSISAAGGKANGVGSSSEFYVGGTWAGFGPAAQSSIISHEMGHVINLWHTHHGCEEGGTWESTDGSNCSTTGDFVCDTPADPFMNFDVNSITCEWNGSALATCSPPEPLSSYEPDAAIIMAYTFPGCMGYFTAGQGQRMRNSIASMPYLQATISNQTTSPCCTENLTLSNTVNSGESYFYEVNDWIKSTGFNLEQMNLRTKSRCRLLMAITVFAYVLSVQEGLKKYKQVPIKIYNEKDKEKAVSIFRFGLDMMVKHTRNIEDYCNYTISQIQLVNRKYKSLFGFNV